MAEIEPELDDFQPDDPADWYCSKLQLIILSRSHDHTSDEINRTIWIPTEDIQVKALEVALHHQNRNSVNSIVNCCKISAASDKVLVTLYGHYFVEFWKGYGPSFSVRNEISVESLEQLTKTRSKVLCAKKAHSKPLSTSAIVTSGYFHRKTAKELQYQLCRTVLQKGSLAQQHQHSDRAATTKSVTVVHSMTEMKNHRR